MAKEDKSVKYLMLKQEFTRALAELEVARLKITDLKSLIQVSAMLNSNIDSHRLLEMIVGTAMSMVKAEAAAVLLYDTEKKDLRYEAMLAAHKGIFTDRSVRVRMGEGVAGWVAQHKLPVFIPDMKKDARFVHFPTRAMGMEVKSILAVPMLSRETLLGVLEAVNPSMKRFVADEAVELFNFFANEAAVAISNARFLTDFRRLFVSTVRSLVQALEAKDPYTSGHAQRVAIFAQILAQELGVPEEEWENVELSALLHDIGKIGVPEEILNKPAKVTEEEYEEIKKHPDYGVKILAPLEHMEKVVPGIVYHHERWDGKGYPRGLQGDAIPLLARIVAVCDALDAMTSTRAYRKALPDEEALRRLKVNSGTQFDPHVTDALFRAYDKGLIITTNHTPKAA